MGNCSTTESSTSQAKYDINVILYDEGTGEEYRASVTKQRVTMWSTLDVTVWSTVKEECSKRNRNVRKITYGGTEIFETQTWEQLGIADDATVIVETEKKQETCQCNTVWSYNHPNMVL